jgi:hypothetical protein
MRGYTKAVAFLIIGALLVAICIYTFRVATAEQLASRVVREYCQRHGYDATKLVGPSKDDVPHTLAAYRWEYHDTTHDIRFLLAFHGFHALTEFDVYDAKTQQTHYPFEDGT